MITVIGCGALLLLALPGCTQQPPPEQTLQVSNRGYQLDQLFTDPRGNTIYRFYDEGDYRYYVVSPNGGVQILPTTRTVNTTGYVGTTTTFVPVETHGGHMGR
jgi:hypothetical protein